MVQELRSCAGRHSEVVHMTRNFFACPKDPLVFAVGAGRVTPREDA